MALPDTVPYIGWAWDDLAFLALAGVMLGAALLTVLGRDIIRSGLWLVLSFAGLAGIYALLGSTLMAVAQVLVYIGAISVLILFAIMITQSKSGPGRLVFQRQWWIGLIAAAVLVVLLLSAILLTTWPLEADAIIPAGRPGRGAEPLRPVPLRVRGDRRAPARCGHRRAVSRPPRPGHARDEPARGAERGARRMSQSLDSYLILSVLLFGIGVFGFLSKRNAIAMLMAIEIMLNAVNLAIVAFGAFNPDPAIAAQGSTIALFVIAVAAAEATVGLAIVIAIYRNRRTPLVDEYASMRE